jgi:organic radical activating enzyme
MTKKTSNYLDKSQTVFNELNQVSKSFCLAKWFNVSIHIPTGHTHSCYHPRSHKIPLEEILIDSSALHNTEYKKKQRKLMIEGERPSECNFCWEIEDSGNQLSDRAYRSADVYEPNIIEEAKSIGHFGNANPRYVEVNFNQACNFKCSYCSPHLSTSWHQEIDKFGSYHLSDRPHHNKDWLDTLYIDNSEDNPYLKAFWEWFPTIYPTLKTFRMTGGEPLMDRNTFKIFDFVKKNKNSQLHLSITSNCCPPGEQWSKFINHIKDMEQGDNYDHFMLYCSLDSVGKQAEYIRQGMNYETLQKNIREFLTAGNKHSLSFINTFNVFSYFGFTDFLKMILELRKEFSNERQLIWFDCPQLSFPEFMNPKMFPDGLKELEKAKEFIINNLNESYPNFKGFYDFELSKVQRLIDWIKSPIEFNTETAEKNFFLFFTEHDKRRKVDLLEAFPELTTFYNNCKKKTHGSLTTY